MKEIIIPERRIYVYSYAELSEESKGTAKQFYLDGQEPETFQDIYEEDLRNLFPRSDLKIEFSLNGCQGDGLNIYGKLDPKDVIGVLHDIAERFSGRLTEKEERTIMHYDAETEYEIELPQNTRYAYCVAYLADFAEDWQEELENIGWRSINSETLEKFQELVREMFTYLAAQYEKYGYEFFYEVDEETMEEVSEGNGWLFNEDGSFYGWEAEGNFHEYH